MYDEDLVGGSHLEIYTIEDEGLATFSALHVYDIPLFLMFLFQFGRAYLCLSFVRNVQRMRIHQSDIDAFCGAFLCTGWQLYAYTSWDANLAVEATSYFPSVA